VRLIVKEILIEDESIIIRHSIPISKPSNGGDPRSPTSRSGAPGDKNYLLRSGRDSASMAATSRSTSASRGITAATSALSVLADVGRRVVGHFVGASFTPDLRTSASMIRYSGDLLARSENRRTRSRRLMAPPDSTIARAISARSAAARGPCSFNPQPCCIPSG